MNAENEERETQRWNTEVEWDGAAAATHVQNQVAVVASDSSTGELHCTQIEFNQKGEKNRKKKKRRTITGETRKKRGECDVRTWEMCRHYGTMECHCVTVIEIELGKLQGNSIKKLQLKWYFLLQIDVDFGEKFQMIHKQKPPKLLHYS